MTGLYPILKLPILSYIPLYMYLISSVYFASCCIMCISMKNVLNQNWNIFSCERKGGGRRRKKEEERGREKEGGREEKRKGGREERRKGGRGREKEGRKKGGKGRDGKGRGKGKGEREGGGEKGVVISYCVNVE